jgi:hypothetical protein
VEQAMDAAKLAVLLFFQSNLGTCGITSDQTIKMKMVVRIIFFTGLLCLLPDSQEIEIWIICSKKYYPLTVTPNIITYGIINN